MEGVGDEGYREQVTALGEMTEPGESGDLVVTVALLRDAMGGVGGGRVVVCASGPATRGPGGVAADEDSELFDFEEKAAKDYVDELSITVSHDDTQLESRPNFSLFGPASHGGPLMSI